MKNITCSKIISCCVKLLGCARNTAKLALGVSILSDTYKRPPRYFNRTSAVYGTCANGIRIACFVCGTLCSRYHIPGSYNHDRPMPLFGYALNRGG